MGVWLSAPEDGGGAAEANDREMFGRERRAVAARWAGGAAGEADEEALEKNNNGTLILKAHLEAHDFKTECFTVHGPSRLLVNTAHVRIHQYQSRKIQVNNGVSPPSASLKSEHVLFANNFQRPKTK